MDEPLSKLTQLQEDLIRRYRYRDPHLDAAIQALQQGQPELCEHLLDRAVVLYIRRDWPEVAMPMLETLKSLHAFSPQVV